MNKTETAQSPEKRKRRNRRASVFPPVLVFVLAIAAGVGVNELIPRSIAPGNLVRIVMGGIFFVGGGLLWITAWRAFKRKGEAFGHRFSTNAVVTDGPYRISRHPAYLAYLSIGIGLALLRDNPWILLMLPFAFWYVASAVARREEHYLMSKFEELYSRYRMEVRRWV